MNNLFHQLPEPKLFPNLASNKKDENYCPRHKEIAETMEIRDLPFLRH